MTTATAKVTARIISNSALAMASDDDGDSNSEMNRATFEVLATFEDNSDNVVAFPSFATQE